MNPQNARSSVGGSVRRREGSLRKREFRVAGPLRACIHRGVVRAQARRSALAAPSLEPFTDLSFHPVHQGLGVLVWLTIDRRRDPHPYANSERYRQQVVTQELPGTIDRDG